MAIIYKYLAFLTKSDDAKFDTLHKPGDQTLHSGIYRCAICSKEITSITDKPLPPQNHHQHTPEQGPIRWQLVVWG